MGSVVAVPVGRTAGKPEAATGSGFDRRGRHPELAAFAVRKEEFEIDRERHPDPVVGRRHQGDIGQVHLGFRFEAEPEFAVDAGDIRDRYGGAPAVAERPVMDEREVRQVDEILQPAPGGGRPGIGLALDAAKRVVAPGRASGNLRAGVRFEAQPDQIVGNPGLDLAQPETGWDRIIRHRGNLDARAAAIVEPSMVGAAQAARLDPAYRQLRRAVDAPVGKGRHGTGNLGNGDPFSEQRDRNRPVVGRGGCEFRHCTDRMPEIPPRAVIEIGHRCPPFCRRRHIPARCFACDAPSQRPPPTKGNCVSGNRARPILASAIVRPGLLP